jgi:alpha-tubulin suppressor-like RCC1 family protein
MAVAAGAEHTVVVGEDGSAFSFGSNAFGQLGIGNTTNRLAPTRITGLPAPVRQVAAEEDHTGIVTDAGDLLMCGRGRHGRLGLGDEEDRATPTRVAQAAFGGEAVLMVACGDQHTAVVTEGGGVYTFGRGKHGLLGHGDEDDQLVPRRVPAAAFNGERIVMVATGLHTVALSEAGHVFTWGLDNFGQLGHGGGANQRAPRQVEAGRFAPPGQGDAPERVVFVAAGTRHTVAVTAGGRLYTWGDGQRGQLGHGDNYFRLVPTLVVTQDSGRVLMAACGEAHTLVVTQDGALLACGRGLDGRLGFNDEADRHVFERVGATLGGARVVAGAAGYHSAAVTEDGALWTWGSGWKGRLGHDNEELRWAPTRVSQASLDGLRIGRCRLLPRKHAVAFAMGTHGRLGAASNVRFVAGEVELLRMIMGWCTTVLPGLAGGMEGLMRLCGGFHAWKQRRAAAGQ